MKLNFTGNAEERSESEVLKNMLPDAPEEMNELE